MRYTITTISIREVNFNFMKNNLKLILGIIGGVVVVGSIAVAMIHFWDDLKKLLPCFGKCDEGLDDFDEIEA